MLGAGRLTGVRCSSDRCGTSPCPAALLFVIQGKPERVAKGHQGSLHGIGLGLLEGGFMGLAQIHVDAMACTAAFTDHCCEPACGDGDTDSGGVGDTPAGLLVPTDRAFGLVDAAHGDRLTLPAIKAKDAVGLSDRDPTFHVSHLSAALLPLSDVGAIEGSGEGSELLGRESAGLGLKGLRSRG